MITLSIVLSLLGITGYITADRPRLRGADDVLARLGHRRRVHLAADVALDGQDGDGRAARRRPHRPRRARLAVSDRRAARRARPACRCRKSASTTRRRSTPSPPARARAAASSRSRAACCARCAVTKSKACSPTRSSHIQNGDMVTMTLIQGVVNAFVDLLLARHRQHHPPAGRRAHLGPRSSSSRRSSSHIVLRHARHRWSSPGSRARASSAPTPAPPRWPAAAT